VDERSAALNPSGTFRPVSHASPRDEPSFPFERQISLEGVEEDKAQADFKNGVLTVTLPKSEQSTRNVKRIAINTN